MDAQCAPGDYRFFLLSDGNARGYGHRCDASYPSTPTNSYATEIRSSRFFAPVGNSVFFYEDDNNRIRRYNSTDNKTTTLVSNVAKIPELRAADSYLYYKNNGAQYFFDPRTNTTTQVPDTIKGGLSAVEGDLAFYYYGTNGQSNGTYTLILTTFDIKTKETNTYRSTGQLTRY